MRAMEKRLVTLAAGRPLRQLGQNIVADAHGDVLRLLYAPALPAHRNHQPLLPSLDIRDRHTNDLAEASAGRGENQNNAGEVAIPSARDVDFPRG